MERQKLRARIIEKYGTLGRFCMETGITATTVTNTLKGRHTPNPIAIIGWCHLLDIPESEADIFFDRKVATAQQMEAR